MSNRRDEQEKERQRAAQEALRGVERDTEIVGTSAFARTAQKARDHFGGADADDNDPIEVWGRRVGRIAGLLFSVGLVIYLIITYVLPK